MPRQHTDRFGWIGPMPSYSWRTRRGSRVSVTGCCLPLPLGCLTLVLGAVGIAAGTTWGAW